MHWAEGPGETWQKEIQQVYSSQEPARKDIHLQQGLHAGTGAQLLGGGLLRITWESYLNMCIPWSPLGLRPKDLHFLFFNLFIFIEV